MNIREAPRLVYPEWSTVLRVSLQISRVLIRTVCACALGCAVSLPAETPVVPLTPCEVVRELPAEDGKTIAVLGRYSFRDKGGRWIAEQTCAAAGGGAVPEQPVLWLVEDTTDGPKVPDHFELDGAAVQRKWAAVRGHTELGKFRFGTPDYDRWAVIWGRVQLRNGEDAKKAPANLVYRGSGVIFFLIP